MTKRQHVGSSWADKIRRGGSVVAAIGVMGSLAIAASGCDTVALISFSERSFTSIHSSGFTPPQSSPANPDACNGVTGDGDMRLRFVLADNDGRPIRLGEAVDNRSVELDQDSILLNDSALMEVSDTGACTDDAECSSSFTCGVAPGIDNNAALKACLTEDDMTVVDNAEAVQFIADNKEHQVYGILMENSGSLSGWNPPGSEGAWDRNADGDTSDPEDARSQIGGVLGEVIATDDLEERFGAVRRTRTPWITAHELADSEGRSTYFGLWSFNETRVTPSSHVANTPATEKHWTNDASTVRSAITDYETQRQAEGHRANVYEAIKNVIDDQYSTAAMEDLGLERADSVDKQLVVFVDGYDDMRENDNVNLDGEEGESLIKAATANNVRLFIVHLDPKLKEPGSLRDDPEYPSSQQPCDPDAADTGCKNYEVCTKPRGYSKNGEDNVSLPDGAGGNYDLDQTYCIPRRDEFGRTGPIDDYARLACATGGGYMYVPTAKAIDENLSWTPLALDGLWEAKIESTSIQRGSAPAGEPLRVHSEMSVNVVGNSRPYSFSQQGNLNTGSDSSDEDFDNRGVVFTAE